MTLRSSSAAILAVTLCSAACDGTTHAEGRVLDASGAPIAGAEVALVREDRSATVLTDSVGAYSVTQVHGVGHASAEVRVCKPGYLVTSHVSRDDSIPRPLTFTLASSPAGLVKSPAAKCR